MAALSRAGRSSLQYRWFHKHQEGFLPWRAAITQPVYLFLMFLAQPRRGASCRFWREGLGKLHFAREKSSGLLRFCSAQRWPSRSRRRSSASGSIWLLLRARHRARLLSLLHLCTMSSILALLYNWFRFAAAVAPLRYTHNGLYFSFVCDDAALSPFLSSSRFVFLPGLLPDLSCLLSASLPSLFESAWCCACLRC